MQVVHDIFDSIRIFDDVLFFNFEKTENGNHTLIQYKDLFYSFYKDPTIDNLLDFYQKTANIEFSPTDLLLIFEQNAGSEISSCK